MGRDHREGRPSHAQMEKLLDLLSEDGMLEDGKVVYTRIPRQVFWKRIAMHLNNVENGVHKNLFKWCKMWADWKAKTKKKADMILSRKNYDPKHIPSFSQLELRLLRLVKYPVDSVIKFLTMKKKSKDNGDEFSNTLSNDNVDSDDDDSYDLNMKSNPNEDKDLFDDSEFNHTGQNESGKTIKMEVFNDTESLINLRMKTKLNLEKERVQQKNEELRLKALELKLKGDELKLREAEINKMNYLTNLEEEKLKCVRDISESLKELVNWTRSSNSSRFHNVM